MTEDFKTPKANLNTLLLSIATFADAAVGVRTDADAGDTGFTVTVTTQGENPS